MHKPSALHGRILCRVMLVPFCTVCQIKTQNVANSSYGYAHSARPVPRFHIGLNSPK